MSKTERVITKIALPIIGIAAFLLVFTFIANTKKKGDESNAYIRVINCIVSYNATSRTQAQIEQCYASVENQMHIKLQRYDNSDK